ncbi:MAG TPA: hypothetical protein PK357_01125 [Candidatus Pacearchaeota archaeon]|nr:hypothetical protein [Candidatus Pacearchaeota archaeon]
MAGLLTHLIISLVGFFIALLVLKNWKYGIAFIFGHLAPDLISFGIAGIKQMSLNPSVIMVNPWFYPLAMFGHNFLHWIIFVVILWVIALFLYNFKKLSKKNFGIIILLLVCLIIGVALHLLFDILVQEANYWI